ncbi:MAG: hypothetical protein OEX19_07535 [Gammaproteobacteria bacterium]|nr:hypothetical protein [Gammaproteobacteria bacterium]
MKPYWSILVFVFVSTLLTACPSQPTKYSEPDEAKSRSDRSMQELDRETR